MPDPGQTAYEARFAGEDKETTELLAGLERELGVQGAGAVFRKALAIAREAAADARARQSAYAANDLIYRLRSWGENDPDPEFFVGDVLHGLLMDCGAGSEAIIAAEARASAAEAEVARLRDELELARKNERFTASHAEEVARQVGTLRERVARLEEALRASEYLTDRYRCCWLGKPARDLPEAHAAHQSARAALNDGGSNA